jgi:riboflavin kinase/FMN adenylyltransferase
MQYYTDISQYQSERESAVTIGKFDSLHVGHQKLIRQVQEAAREYHLTRIVFAFDMDKPSLLTRQERRRFLEGKVDCLIQSDFPATIRDMEPEQFIEDILWKRLHVHTLVVGPDFRFGKGARGDLAMLEQYAKRLGFTLQIVEKAREGQREISSTYAREALYKGDVRLLTRLLGYPYRLQGRVMERSFYLQEDGKMQLKLEVPARKLLPLEGSYACKLQAGEENRKRYGTLTISALKEASKNEKTGKETSQQVILEIQDTESEWMQMVQEVEVIL